MSASRSDQGGSPVDDGKVLFCISRISKRRISACCKSDFCCVAVKGQAKPVSFSRLTLIGSSKQKACPHEQDSIPGSFMSARETSPMVVSSASGTSPPRLVLWGDLASISFRAPYRLSTGAGCYAYISRVSMVNICVRLAICSHCDETISVGLIPQVPIGRTALSKHIKASPA
jgi:hypothetical protein